MTKQDELLNVLAAKNLFNQTHLREAKKSIALGKTLEGFVAEKNILDLEELAKIKASVYGLPYENLHDKKIGDDVSGLIPSEVSENYQIVCFGKNNSKINIGIVDPDNFKAIEAINFLAKKDNLHVSLHLISEASFKSSVKQIKTLTKEVSTALKDREEDETKEEEEVIDEVLKSAPVAKIVSVILRHAVDGRASDIHIEPLQKESRVRYRIDGVLQNSLVLPKSMHDSIIARIKVMSSLKLDETRLPQDGRIREKIGGRLIDFRVSVLPLLGKEKVVMRVLDNSRGAPTLEALGYMGPGLRTIQKNTQKTEGLFLVTGPTGSGKSTTIFSVINIINREGINISTLEDPIEYFVEGINQTQIRPEIGFTFAGGLRSLLRQDPNVIMVGEIRDNETAELAIHAGLTGHFVLSTLHTNDAIGAIPRLLDMKVEPFLLGSTVNTVVAQRLARKICPNCKEVVSIPEELVLTMKKELKNVSDEVIKELLPEVDLNNMVFYKGKGCSRCANSGYSGRVAISEVIDMTEGVQEIIIENKNILKLEDIRKSQNFLTMREDGMIKVLLGLTTMEELLRVVFD